MDRTEEDMKHVGFSGIFKQSFKTIFSRKKIFTQITLTSILPLTVIFLVYMEISNHFFWGLETNYLPSYASYRNITLTQGLYYCLFKILYFTLLALFSLLSTAAVIFTIASVYTNREVVFQQLIIKVVPNIWKKLCFTLVLIYFAVFIYNVINKVIIFILISIFGYSILGLVLLHIILILYVLGFLYLSVVCQLASAVTVLENVYGFKAMKKGKVLANGKKKVGMGIAFVIHGILYGLILMFKLFVDFGFGDDDDPGLTIIWRVMIGLLCGLLIMILFLLFIVTQTVLYLVCKSYHREAIDKMSLSTFLSVYTEETLVYPKPGEEIQLGNPQPPPAQLV